MLTQIDLTLGGINATYEVDGKRVVIVLTNDEIAKTKDIFKLAGERLTERLKVLAAADELRGTL